MRKIEIILSDRFRKTNEVYRYGTANFDMGGDYYSLRGTFAVIKDCQNFVELACDIVRSIPLFYYVTKEIAYVSDSVRAILNSIKGSINVNASSIKEYLMLGYVSENETFFENIYSVRAGEIVRIEKNSSFRTVCGQTV